MKNRPIALVILFLFLQSVPAQDKPSIPDVDRVRLAEAFRLGESIRDSIWKDWDKAPFAVLLVMPEYEFLIRHPQPSEDFNLLGYDSLLKSNVYFRKRTQRTDFLATFPAIKGSMIPTIVVGRAENTTAKTSTAWVVTLMHEHFHQLQYSRPGYYADVNALNLSGGDKTGMWMLNYPFPYDKKDVQEQFSVLSKVLVETLKASSKEERQEKLVVYAKAKREFEQMLGTNDCKYFSFQLWQEGVARYTEYQVAQFAATKYKPSKEFRALKDFILFGQVANSTNEGIFEQLLTRKLGESRREMFYPFGAAQALLLDRVAPSWRGRYFAEKFDLGHFCVKEQ